MGRDWRDITAFAFASFLAVYGMVRAGHELRWSYWAYGDAQHLNGAIHFRDEGFAANHFLLFPSPGTLNYFVPNNWPNGRYTHYPTLHTVIAGLWAKIFGNPLYPSRFCAVLFSSLSLILWYFFFKNFFGNSAALLAIVFIGFSIIHLDFMDCVSNVAYDFFFRISALVLIVKSAAAEKRAESMVVDGLLWAVLFLSASNSVEYIVYCEIFLIGTYGLTGRLKTSLGKIAIFSAAPLAAVSLHFLQTVWEWGSVIDAMGDWNRIFVKRIAGKAQENVLPNLKAYMNALRFLPTYLIYYLNVYYGTAILACLVYWPIRFYRDKREFLQEIKSAQSLKIMALLGLCGISFWILMPWQSCLMGSYIPSHFFPVLACVFALTAEDMIKNSKIIFVERSFNSWNKKTTVFLLIAGLACLAVPFRWTAQYLENYPNLINRPLWHLWKPIPLDEWIERFRQAKLIEKETQWGDIILVPNSSKGITVFEGNALEEFYAQRKYIPMGDHPSDLNRRMDLLKDYRSRYAAKDPRISRIKFYIWTDALRMGADMISYVQDHFEGRSIEPGRLILYQLNF